ncbi:MAG: DUF3307 domain-containing protein [Coriobacteriales bacterium]|jgi:hypothetical protein|nr:DUF3307 domain-containing protein [Coriobacteriales bacterium]
MMLVNSSLFWLVLGAHLLGDFYFQNEKLAREKNDGSFYALATHSCYYAATMLLITLCFYGGSALLLGVALSVIHFLIDWVKMRISSQKVTLCSLKRSTPPTRKKQRSPRCLFFCDQLVHLITITLATVTFLSFVDTSHSPLTLWLQCLYENRLQVTLPPDKFVQSVVILLLLIRPVNIAIRMLGSKTGNDLGMGRYIGILERLIVLILALYGQYSAIAFVFAAKSIARFKKIENEPAFAEYYLMGTLFSALTAILGAIVINL